MGPDSKHEQGFAMRNDRQEGVDGDALTRRANAAIRNLMDTSKWDGSGAGAVLEFSPGACEAWADWCVLAEGWGEAFKMERTAARLAMLLHMIDGGCGPVSADAAARAVSIVEERALVGGRFPDAMALGRAQEMVRRVLLGVMAREFSHVDLGRQWGHSKSWHQPAKAAIEELIDLGYLREAGAALDDYHPATVYRVAAELQ